MGATQAMAPLVLLIEDDDDAREVMGDVLEKRGLQVLRARNGAHALRTIRERGLRPDAIVLDLTMPVMSGEQFLEEQAREPLLAQVPVVIATAQVEHPPAAAPIVRILSKPVQLSVLFDTIAHMVEGVPAPVAFPRGTDRMPPLDEE